MTGEEYIALTRRILPVHSPRNIKTIQSTLEYLIEAQSSCTREKPIEFKSIASSSFFPEAINTSPCITIIWDNYQWELIEKFFLSALYYDRGNLEEAKKIFKMNIYPALSIRLTKVSPALSYMFARKYREIIDGEDHAGYVIRSEYLFTDLLYSEIIFLGHEFSHVLFEYYSSGKMLYKFLESDFVDIMRSAIKTNIIPFSINNDDMGFKRLVSNIQKPCNSEYRKELICDAFSYSLLGRKIEEMEKIHSDNNGRNTDVLYCDILSITAVVVKLMNSFLYLLDFWTRIGSITYTRGSVEPKDIASNIPNYRVWGDQFLARELLVPFYMRLFLLRERDIFISLDVDRYAKLYNNVAEIYKMLISYDDPEWDQIMIEYNQLLAQKISLTDLIEARDNQLGI